MAADDRAMWLNAMRLVAPTEEILLGIGRDVVEMVQRSMRRDRHRDEFEPIGHVTIDITAS